MKVKISSFTRDICVPNSKGSAPGTSAWEGICDKVHNKWKCGGFTISVNHCTSIYPCVENYMNTLVKMCLLLNIVQSFSSLC